MIEVIIAEDTGFCYGVKRAIDLLNRRLKNKKEVFSLGPVIHNRLVGKELKGKGLKIVENPSQIKSELLVRCHGLHPVLIEEARKRKIKIIDATCPFLRMVQRRIRYLVANGYRVIIVGDSNHPEVKALAGFAHDEAIIIDKSSKFKVKSLEFKKVGVVGQTTINTREYHRIVTGLYKKLKPEEFLVFNTICKITEKRQREVGYLSRKVNFFLVLGSKESSNTRTLFELCRKKRPSFLIEEPSQIKEEWFTPIRDKSLTEPEGKVRVGLLSGTSTPGWLVKETADTLAKLN
ncbi:MAG: 4-hydroxy-3-methylbut-2-enyl diphosphate reductase [bacterium (Candidatus Ratteibacteria) CG_4_9_14_3_um_filter_41_21]|uniref:4-hydroxy-3-methylbut-2-enyl diphosphate reductase n=3 Tax=Candidatus Ratteibacteria TaxID=2979319 RepID=A0A2M7YHN5_9BACT|nr:MAG: 4-hydroxy-3-methylbut-2-enyl diphosphate reductase [Candidatus Omnitrophica bacterium CG1_02_41_171]PIV64269.1 MAG: 4-hydroxy-3-methylbut-2-enyl diphosphate reductase [bacterium (Candidatus Ratteibacteria) CG01_land_8_20_14_3_00_40_19]PIW33960.1 MAG: 4-hydroxy-3-methylbut-2-enyl diphosphate reductase [bacterium (Candidatus Ratteibacteria) CG15_BIG_FIL_POST_REV_8_21_14_020_41_12]PIW73802.1 MAG: 4-hydroxy-3-methylbut-2-enyl diphosphate reductase [bacterium (Candidatus Ratteibacteria) CG_4_